MFKYCYRIKICIYHNSALFPFLGALFSFLLLAAACSLAGFLASLFAFYVCLAFLTSLALAAYLLDWGFLGPACLPLLAYTPNKHKADIITNKKILCIRPI